jgi:hypothetical protein
VSGDNKSRNRHASSTIVVPPEAHHWAIDRLTTEEKNGKKFARRTGMTSDPLSDGTVPRSWPASEFSPARVLEHWGPGKYRVEFFDMKGEMLTGTARVFDVATPKPAAGPALRKTKHAQAREPVFEDDDDPPARRRGGGGGDSLSVSELIMLQREDRAAQEAREERLAERARQDAVAQQQRDREFMGMVMATMQQSRAPVEASSDLLRRELALEIKEGLSRIRRDLDDREPDDPDPEDETPPKDLDEAGTRIGMRLLSELEQRAPDLIEEAIPRIADYLKTKGFKPSAELEAAMAQKPTNGRAHRP